MRQSRSGFSVVEAMVGLSIIALVLYAATNVFKPIGAAARKAKILNTMMKVENLIREGVYVQTDYSDLNKFEIKNVNEIVAKHGVITFLNEDMSPCSAGASCALQTQLEVVDFSGGKKGVIYRITTGENSGLRTIPLGVTTWPETAAEKIAHMVMQEEGNLGASSSTIVIPSTILNSSSQKCENGFIRGVSNGNQLICWRFIGEKKCPSWAIPVGYRIDETASTMELLCQKLNRLDCPQMSVRVTNPGTGIVSNIPLDNFYALNKLQKTDLYPPRASAATGASECRSIVNFSAQNIANSSGVIAAPVVAANNGRCPDVNLYKKNIDGTCRPNFDPDSISDWVLGQIRPNPIRIVPASELRAIAGESQ